MAFGDIHGKARVSATNPQAFAVCDAGGEWRNAVDLHWQFEWTGNQLVNLGFRICKEHLDKPQEQFRTPILPGDPKPIMNPRVEFFEADRGNFGFTLWTLQPPILTTDPLSVSPKTAVLNAIAAISGIPFPSPLTDFAGSLSQPAITLPLVAALGGRQFILIYNPTTAPFVVSTGKASFSGDPLAILLGPGNGLFWAAAQGKGPLYAGAMTICGYQQGQAWFGWEA